MDTLEIKKRYQGILIRTIQTVKRSANWFQYTLLYQKRQAETFEEFRLAFLTGLSKPTASIANIRLII